MTFEFHVICLEQAAKICGIRKHEILSKVYTYFETFFYSVMHSRLEFLCETQIFKWVGDLHLP